MALISANFINYFVFDKYIKIILWDFYYKKIISTRDEYISISLKVQTKLSVERSLKGLKRTFITNSFVFDKLIIAQILFNLQLFNKFY